MLETEIDPELGWRLEHVYKLSRRPTTLGEVRELFKAKRDNPGVEAYLERVRTGEAVIGACCSRTP